MSALTKTELHQLQLTKRRQDRPPEQWDEIMRALIRGASVKQLAAKYCVGPSTIVRKRSEYLAKLKETE